MGLWAALVMLSVSRVAMAAQPLLAMSGGSLVQSGASKGRGRGVNPPPGNRSLLSQAFPERSTRRLPTSAWEQASFFQLVEAVFSCVRVQEKLAEFLGLSELYACTTRGVDSKCLLRAAFAESVLRSQEGKPAPTPQAIEDVSQATRAYYAARPPPNGISAAPPGPPPAAGEDLLPVVVGLLSMSGPVVDELVTFLRGRLVRAALLEVAEDARCRWENLDLRNAHSLRFGDAERLIPEIGAFVWRELFGIQHPQDWETSWLGPDWRISRDYLGDHEIRRRNYEWKKRWTRVFYRHISAVDAKVAVEAIQTDLDGRRPRVVAGHAVEAGDGHLFAWLAREGNELITEFAVLADRDLPTRREMPRGTGPRTEAFRP